MLKTTPLSLTLASTASLREIFLQRLQRLQQLRQRHQRQLNGHGLRLLDRSVFAAYCDCRDAGAEEEARAFLRNADCVLDEHAVQADESRDSAA